MTTSGTGGAGGGGGTWRSPVYLMPRDNNPPTASSIAGIMSATGEKNFLLSFVLDAGGCAPAVSFGGYNGTELGQTCGSASALASALRL